MRIGLKWDEAKAGLWGGGVRGLGKGPAKRGNIVAATLLRWSCFPKLTRLATHATFVADTKKCFWKSSEKFLVSARRAMFSRFATDGQHRRTQCCRHNVSSFCRGLKLVIWTSIEWSLVPMVVRVHFVLRGQNTIGLTRNVKAKEIEHMQCSTLSSDDDDLEESST